MVQWFKRWFSRRPQIRVLEYNRAKLNEEMQNLSTKLAFFKHETSLKIIREVLEMSQNVQMLEINRFSKPDDLMFHRGRLQALADLGGYIDRSMSVNPMEDTDQKSRDTIRVAQPRRTANQAGAAI